MPLSTQSQSQDEQYVLVANLDNARNLSNILKAITCKDHAIFTATANGLKVTVEDCKCMQANAFIQQHSEYHTCIQSFHTFCFVLISLKMI
uniref:RAD1 homolog (S. pombe) n=1 Tax=Xiphophorus couchianus TaxID=32473 RepID=A0A3B5KYK5_9TELE